jgi:hypothetical protein
MMAITAVFDGIPRTGIDENRFHSRLAFFTIQILVVGHSGIWQMTWNGGLAQLTKGFPGRVNLFYLRLEESYRYLELRIGCRF